VYVLPTPTGSASIAPPLCSIIATSRSAASTWCARSSIRPTMFDAIVARSPKIVVAMSRRTSSADTRRNPVM
jgi:hypothetical protein